MIPIVTVFFCSVVDPCLLNPCENNGTCFTMAGLGIPFVCLCTNGYTGDTCAIGKNRIKKTISILIIRC